MSIQQSYEVTVKYLVGGHVERFFVNAWSPSNARMLAMHRKTREGLVKLKAKVNSTRPILSPRYRTWSQI